MNAEKDEVIKLGALHTLLSSCATFMIAAIRSQIEMVKVHEQSSIQARCALFFVRICVTSMIDVIPHDIEHIHPCAFLQIQCS